MNLGLDQNTVIDSMRPYTQELWMKLPHEEQKRFLHHLSRYFEIIRSRIPPQNMSVVKQMIETKQLTIIKGRITNITSTSDSAIIHYQQFTGAEESILNADVVINCTGPN
jgi:uncharacterized NAD(P)/FAD-binding protein YdhS